MSKIGFYGGKFIPFHKGHRYCVERACQMCDKVYVILFDSPENKILEHNTLIDEFLTIEARMEQLRNLKTDLAKEYPKVEIEICFINTDECLAADGSEDWDKETPLVLKATHGKFDFVYSSEPSYDAYFKRAYPFATHVLVDPPRITYPISGTKIREMEKTLALEWIFVNK